MSFLARWRRNSDDFGWLTKNAGRNVGYNKGPRIVKTFGTTLADFRTEHVELLNTTLTNSVAVLMQEGLVTLDRVAQDGMKVRASARGRQQITTASRPAFLDAGP